MDKNDQAYYRQLLQRYLQDDLSVEELQQLFDYIQRNPEQVDALAGETGRKKFEERLQQNPFLPQDTSARMEARLLESIRGSETGPAKVVEWQSRSTAFIGRYWKAAAVILLLLSAGGYFWLRSPVVSNPVVINKQKQDIAPGGNKAVLTLADGSRIILDSARNGQLASQGVSKVMKLNNGLLTYRPVSSRSDEPVQYNMLSIPRGGQYELVLPDGTHVWLNAASSIRYPTAFTRKERLVEITGEAYFEVKHDARMPFKIKVGNEIIKDIGTHFNINAYADEPLMKVTLLEGAVSVSEQGNREETVLRPGQQAQVHEGGQISVLKDADTEQAVAWKNGLFQFTNATVQEVLRQMSRWYDVDIVYETNPTAHLAGVMGRDIHLSQAIQLLQTNGVHCKIEDHKLIIMK